MLKVGVMVFFAALGMFTILVAMGYFFGILDINAVEKLEKGTMKLWLLRPRDAPLPDSWDPVNVPDPWEPWYDKAFGFVIRAETEEDARRIASSHSGAETDVQPWPEEAVADAWTNPKYSTCTELVAEGGAGEIIRDFRGA
jgi:hypothetical protein